jgi:hypothetical protein
MTALKLVMASIWVMSVVSCETMKQYNLKPQVDAPKDADSQDDYSTTQAGVTFEAKLSSFGSRYFLYQLITNGNDEEITVSASPIKVATSCGREAVLKGASIYKGRDADAVHARFTDVKSEGFSKHVVLAPHEEWTINYTFQMPVGRCGIIESEFSGVIARGAAANLTFKRKFEVGGGLF